ncbi:MAG: hypothetical protein Fur0024_2260 [Patescibacteria group bacterium]
MSENEMIYEVDENDEVIGVRARREFVGGKFIHRNSHLILMNSERKILIQKRSPKKCNLYV